MELNKNKILIILQLHTEELKSLGVKRLGLFGSYARNEQKDNSDIDLLVDFDIEMKTFRNFMRTAFLLQDIFQKKVELVTPQSISEGFKNIISPDLEYVAIN